MGLEAESRYGKYGNKLWKQVVEVDVEGGRKRCVEIRVPQEDKVTVTECSDAGLRR